MDLADQILPRLNGYVKAYNDISSDDDSTGELEKQILLGEETFQIQRVSPQPRSIACFVHALLILTNVAFATLFYTWTVSKYSHGPNLHYSPVRSAIQYEQRVFELADIYRPDHQTLNPGKPTRFNGPPSRELEQEWDDLVRYQNLRLSREELGGRADESGIVELPDGGFFGTLTVFHSLHCVRRLHHFIYKDHYYPNISDPDFYRLKAHADHCLDTLRQNIQCAADTTVQVMHWGSSQPIPLGHDDGTHECVNWEMMNEWAKERTFSPMAPGYLSHPNLGLAYPDGKGDALGIINDKYLADAKGEPNRA